MKCLYVYFLLFYVIISAEVPKDVFLCQSCVPTFKCPFFGNLNTQNQQLWLKNFHCETPQKARYGRVSSIAKDDYVCCLWGIENSGQFRPPSDSPSDKYSLPYDDYEKNRSNNVIVWYPDRRQNYDNTDYWATHKGNDMTSNMNGNELKSTNRYWNERRGRQWNYVNGSKNKNNVQKVLNHKTSQRPSIGNNQPQPPFNNYNIYDSSQTVNRNQNNFYNTNTYRPRSYYPENTNNNDINDNPSNGQCDRLTSFPPDPRSGCCGRQASDDDRITGSLARPFFAPPNNFHETQSTQRNGKFWRSKRAADGNNVTVKVDSRISGGRATELYQYPWTVLLKTTFNYGIRQQAFNCGGSLISAKYVLTAGHCVYENGATVNSVVISLAEYDKRTFPRDCKTSQSGRKCIENIVINAESIVLHPQFSNEQLQNDIALIRLGGNVPYTEYTRPICLPTINVDEPRFSNLQFEVAGWGMNGQFVSDVKQSAAMHLVNQNQCKRFYPMLTIKHLCAAGYQGQDTCKGDSGGPLMTLYRGQYYATGVVSGKRADSPCGTAVPSLYTNVYHYLDWIRSNIRN